MFARIGFFHFAENYHEPFRSLDEALSEQGDVGDSLVVLPEAFNNGKAYYDQPRMRPAFARLQAVEELVRIATKHSVAFVAGLLDPPLSSAYWIDSSGGRLLHHKTSDDHTGNYEPCISNCDFHNPSDIDGMRVGVLICNDIEFHVKGMMAELDERTDVRRILCIPACMGDQWFGTGELSYDYWHGKYVILANSNAHGCGSFVSNAKGQREMFVGQRNSALLRTYDELDRRQTT